jgi:hypothetical protein
VAYLEELQEFVYVFFLLEEAWIWCDEVCGKDPGVDTVMKVTRTFM